MRPSLPLPAMAPGSSLFSATIRWTDGASGRSGSAGLAGGCGAACRGGAAGPPAAGAAPPPAGARGPSPAPAGRAGALAGGEPASPMWPSTWPGSTVAPSSATMSASTPSSDAATSRLTLSVSSSTSTSSFFTASPGFFAQRATVASVTDSPSAGVMMSAIETGSFRSDGLLAEFTREANASAAKLSDERSSGERLAEERLQLLHVPAHQARGGGGRGRPAHVAGAFGGDLHAGQRELQPRVDEG